MKRILMIVPFVLFALGGFAQTPANIASTKAPEIAFEQDSFDFGTISYGKPAQHEFIFTNTGKEPLKITDLKADCTCITATFSKEPVAPGKTGTIILAYDTKRVGLADKKVMVTSNAKTPLKELTLKIQVLDGETPKTPDDMGVAPNPPGNIFDN